MAWHKFATIKTDAVGDFVSTIAFGCASSQGLGYEIHVVSETKPDTISATNTGVATFIVDAEAITPLFLGETANTEYDLWLDLDAQVYTDISVAQSSGTISSINLSNSVLDVATYSLANIGLESITGIDELTNLNSLTITGNGLSASNMDAIVADLWDYAITNAKTGGSFSYATGNDALSTTSQQIVDALEDSMQWNSGTGVITAITNEYELQAIGVPANLGLSYVLMNDIDAAVTETWNDGAGFVPIGTDTVPFTGTFDGKNFTIADLFINRPNEDNIAIFGRATGTGIRLKNCKVISTDHNVYKITGRARAAGFVASFICQIDNIYTNIPIFATMVGSSYSGGVFGLAQGKVSHCYADGDVTGTSLGTNDLGGLGGIAQSGVEDCYATGLVMGNNNIGGLVGRTNINGLVKRSFAYNNQPLIGVEQVGNAHEKCYQLTPYTAWTAGEYVEPNIREYEGVVYRANTTTSEEPSSTATDWDVLDITTLTAAEFRVRSNFTGFDFIDVWRMGKDYPELRAFSKSRFKRLRSRLIRRGR